MFQFIKSLFSKTQDSPTAKAASDMKYLIVGLGNIGEEYENTRHNVGLIVADYLAQKFEVNFNIGSHAFFTEFKHKSRTFVLIKPTTYMNLSGKAVRYWLQKHNIPKENLLVIVDDLNLPFGKLRLRPNGANAGHNGLKDIDAVLGGNNYARLRIGIGDSFPKGGQVAHVLGKWKKKEQEELPNILDAAAKTVLSFGTIGLAQTMNLYNK